MRFLCISDIHGHAAALRRVGCGPQATVLIGDTPYDVEAGARAGVAVIAFRSGGWSDAPLQGALALYDGAAGRLLAQALHSQVEMHEAYGGIVPELASRLREAMRSKLPRARSVVDDRGCTPRRCASSRPSSGRTT